MVSAFIDRQHPNLARFVDSMCEETRSTKLWSHPIFDMKEYSLTEYNRMYTYSFVCEIHLSELQLIGTLSGTFLYVVEQIMYQGYIYDFFSLYETFRHVRRYIPFHESTILQKLLERQDSMIGVKRRIVNKANGDKRFLLGDYFQRHQRFFAWARITMANVMENTVFNQLGANAQARYQKDKIVTIYQRKKTFDETKRIILTMEPTIKVTVGANVEDARRGKDQISWSI
jgi:hypothetical protein